MSYDELTSLPPLGQIESARFGRLYGLKTSDITEASFFAAVLFALLDIEVTETEDGKSAVFIIDGKAVERFLQLFSPDEIEELFDASYFTAVREMLARYAETLHREADA
jgi:hypothetical protein